MLTFQQSGKGNIICQHLSVWNYKKIFFKYTMTKCFKNVHYDIFCKLQTFLTMYPYLGRV